MTGYRVYRGTASGQETALTTVGNVTGYSVTGLAAKTAYYYRVRVYNGSGTSLNSNVIKVKTKRH